MKKEFKHRLRNRDPESGWEGYVATTNEIVENLLKMTTQSEPFTKEELDQAIKKLKKGTAPDCYGMHSDILINAHLCHTAACP